MNKKRDRYLAALKARLEQIRSAADASLVLEPAALNDARRLARVLRDDEDDVEARYVLGWLYLYRYSVTNNLQDLDAAIAFTSYLIAGGGQQIPQPLLSLVINVVTALLHQAATSTGVPVNAAITMLRQLVAASSDADRARALALLSSALRLRFQQIGDTADLDEAIKVGRAAVAASTDHLNRARYLSDLGNALRARYARTGSSADLKEAIEVGRRAVAAIPPGQPDRAWALLNLSLALEAQFERSGALAVLREAIILRREAVQAIPNLPERASYLSSFDSALRALPDPPMPQPKPTRHDVVSATAASPVELGAETSHRRRTRRRFMLLGVRSAFDLSGQTLMNRRLAPPPRRFLADDDFMIDDNGDRGPVERPDGGD